MAGSTEAKPQAEAKPEAEGDPKPEGLDKEELAQAADASAPHARVIHEVVRQEGEVELKRSVGALVWSGLAAGLSMGFSLLSMSFLHAGLPDKPWRHLVESPGYSVGFVITILGRQQLFTESTLTSLLPFLVLRDRKTLLALLRTWGVVLAANLVGTSAFAAVISPNGIFPDAVHQAMVGFGTEILEGEFGPKMLRAVFAGWLIALMVWLLPSARSARLFVIMLLTYVVALGTLPHIIAGSVEAAFAVFSGHASVRDYLVDFLAPTLLGNTIGGVALAALLNYAPLAPEFRGPQKDDEKNE
jgi:formate/nitrite transporter FocA (FNT family)